MKPYKIVILIIAAVTICVAVDRLVRIIVPEQKQLPAEQRIVKEHTPVLDKAMKDALGK